MGRRIIEKTIELLLLLPLLISVAFMDGCVRKKEIAMPPVPVVTAKVVRRAVPLVLSAVGSVEPIESVSLRPQVNGIITRVAFSEGADVREGQLLFQIDPRPFQASLDAAAAQLAKDKAQAENADVQAKRYADLSEKEYATKEQYDTYRTQAEVFGASVKADEAAMRQAELNLAYASITAPISGRTGNILVKKGNVIRANTDVLVSINQLRPIRIGFSIPENRLSQVRKYSASHRLEVNARSTGTSADESVKGLLTFVDNEVDPATGTVALKAEFPNEQGLLWPGQFVNVDIILDMESGALTVPAGALVTGQDGTFVFVVGQDKKAEKRSVRLNRTLDDTAVIDEGLMEGETVVTDGQMRLVPGASVEIKSDAPAKGKTP
jgi:membrane fusion protein, multidrug efflux system